MMRSDAGPAGPADAMTDFMNSSLNKSGVSAASMATLMQQLRNGTGQLH